MADIKTLYGSDKLREAYPKINKNFSAVNNDTAAINTRVNNLVNQTQIDPNKDPEVIDLRHSTLKDKTFDTATARVEDIEQEIIGARKGEVSLGAKIEKMDNDLISHKLDMTQQFSEIRSEIAEATFVSHNGKKYTLNNPYKKNGTYKLKVQLHGHTTGSDGVDTPVTYMSAYKNAGYAAAAITDHDVVTNDPGVEGIIFIKGVEEFAGDNHAHMIALDIINQSTSTCIATALEFHKLNNSLTGIAHPESGMIIPSREDLKILNGYNFIEVYNATGQYYGEKSWDSVLSLKKKVFGIAVDDCHDVNETYGETYGYNFDKGWVVVKSDGKTKEDILKALRDGNYYATNGNDIEISVKDNVLTAVSTASSKFEFIGKNGYVYKTENGITTSSYTIKGDEVYIRVKSTRLSDNKEAWAQPIFIDILQDDEIRSEILKNSENRNFLVNSNFDVWQRGVSFNNPHGAYTADRWLSPLSPTGATWAVQKSSQLDKYGANALKVTLFNTSPVTDVALNIRQILESQESRYLKGRTVTFSALLKAVPDLPFTKASLHVYSGTGTDEKQISTGYIATTRDIPYTDIPTSEYKLFSISATIPWNSNQVGVGFSLTGSTSSAFYVKQAQLIAGTESLPYIAKSYSEELRNCMRYYQRYSAEKGLDVNKYTAFGMGQCTSATSARIFIPLRHFLRTGILTYTYSEPTTFAITDASGAHIPLTSLSFLGRNENSMIINATVAGGLSGGNATMLVANNNLTAFLDFAAEL